MTSLTKPITRRTENKIQQRPIVVTLYPGGTIGLRLLKTRHEEILTVEAAYSLAVKQRIARERAEKKARKAK